MTTEQSFSNMVALVTGAARGQGRSHAVELAREGASVIAVDICQQIATVPYPMSSDEDLAETVRLVEAAGGRIAAYQADVRDFAALSDAVRKGVEELGRLDVVVANAGVVNGIGPLWEITEEQFDDQIDVNLKGVWHTIKAATPFLLEQGDGGSVILISSIAGMIAEANVGHYTAAKHGVNGLMRVLAAELAPHAIRVNAINPGNVNTLMIDNPPYNELFSGGLVGATQQDSLTALREMNALPVPFVEPIDISRAVLYLASEAGRYVTGTTMVVDAGALQPFKVR